MKIFIAGDKYFQPEVMIPLLQEKLKGLSEPVEFDSGSTAS